MTGLQGCNERYEGLGWTDRINVLMYAPGMTAPLHNNGAETSSHDRAVLITTEPQDGRITVSWEPNEDTITPATTTTWRTSSS